ncbi:hypothetical protein D3C83_191120 [compost metagenome]
MGVAGQIDKQAHAGEVRRGAHLGDGDRVRQAARVAAQPELLDRPGEHRHGERAEDADEPGDDHDLDQRET